MDINQQGRKHFQLQQISWKYCYCSFSEGFPGGGSDGAATNNALNGSGGGGGGAGTQGYGWICRKSSFDDSSQSNKLSGGDGYQVPAPFLDPFKPVIPNPFLNGGSHSDPGFRYFGAGAGGSDHNNNGGTGRNYGVPGGLGGGGRGAQDPGPGSTHGSVGLNHRGSGGGGGATHGGVMVDQVDLDVVSSSISSNRIIMINTFWEAIERAGSNDPLFLCHYIRAEDKKAKTKQCRC